MAWQDLVIAVVNAILTVSLVPQVYQNFRNKKGPITFATSIPTFLGLYVMAFCFITLSLYYSAIMVSLCGTLWLVFFIQRIIYAKA